MSSHTTPAQQFIVPDFYSSTSDSPVYAVSWLQENLSLSDEYIANLVKVRPDLFAEWKNGNPSLTSSQVKDLKAFSSTMTRLLSFLNFRRDLMLKMLEFHNPEERHRPTKLTPPWLGTSLKAYMKNHGHRGIREVDSWIQAMRSANSF